MAGVVHTGMTNCAVLVVLRLVVGLGLMVGSRGVVGCRGHHRGVIRWRGWFMVGWRRGGIWRRFMIGWGRWGIRCWLMVDWWGWGIWRRLMIGWGRGCIRGWWWGSVGGRFVVGRGGGGIGGWWWWWGSVGGRGGIWLRDVDSRGVGSRGRGIWGSSSPKVGELGEPFDSLVFQALLQVHLLAVKTLKA